MIKNAAAVLIASGIVFAWPAQSIEAKVVRLVVERTTPYAGGKAFGEAGAFERLEGTVYMEVDPHDPLNAIIVNLDRALRNDTGMVEFSAPFVISGQPSLSPSTTDVCLFDGFQSDRIYELTYPAKNPWVMGLGYAVTRDLGSFLRYEGADAAGNPNPLTESAGRGIRRVYGLGISSTGMYMRDFLYLGFNEDEAHRQVFDAVRIHIPGTHRLFANVEFADPNVYSRQDQHPDFTSHSYPPLTYAVTTDPRPSLEERYGDHGGFVDAVRRASEQSVRRRFLREEDARIIVQMAEASDILR